MNNTHSTPEVQCHHAFKHWWTAPREQSPFRRSGVGLALAGEVQFVLVTNASSNGQSDRSSAMLWVLLQCRLLVSGPHQGNDSTIFKHLRKLT